MTASSVRREPRDVWFLWRDGLWLQTSTKSLERHRPRRFHQRDISAGAIKLSSCQRQLSRSSRLLPAYQGLQFTVVYKKRSEAQHRSCLAGSGGRWTVIAHEGGRGTARPQPSSEQSACPGAHPASARNKDAGKLGHQPRYPEAPETPLGSSHQREVDFFLLALRYSITSQTGPAPSWPSRRMHGEIATFWRRQMLKPAPPCVPTWGRAWRATLALDTLALMKAGVTNQSIEGVFLPGEASKPRGPLPLSFSRVGLLAAAAEADVPPKTPSIGDIRRVRQPA